MKNAINNMSWYDQTDSDFENNILLEAKFILSSLEANEITINGKDAWGVDVILFNWNNYAYELMLILYDGPGKSEIIINNLVTDKKISFNNELDLKSKITIDALQKLI
jgi:hypothetical protein